QCAGNGASGEARAEWRAPKRGGGANRQDATGASANAPGMERAAKRERNGGRPSEAAERTAAQRRRRAPKKEPAPGRPVNGRARCSSNERFAALTTADFADAGRTVTRFSPSLGGVAIKNAGDGPFAFCPI